MNKLSKIKSKIKKSMFRTLAVLALAVTFVVPSSVSNSYATGTQTPRFNFLQGDKEMLRAANYTKGQADWADPVTGTYKADIGDEVVFNFYFHNGVLESTAHNTTLKATLPVAYAATQKVTSSLKSDETAAISDTVVNGNIVGTGSGYAQVDLTSAARLEYVAGSTRIWRENPNEDGVTLPDGITSANGLNIGNIQGCWQYAGFVTFKTKVVAEPVVTLGIEKKVARPGTTSWSEQIADGKEGETFAWSIQVQNHGNTVAKNVLVKDVLPAEFTYVKGTTVYYAPNTGANGWIMQDGIAGNGMIVDEIQPGAANTIGFTFQATLKTNLTYTNGKWTGVNWASAIYNNIEVKDSASVIATGKPGITIQKQVWNGSAWVETNYVNLGENIRYRIQVTNSGQVALNNVLVNDVIPVYTKYVNGSTKVDGSSVSDGIALAGINIGSIAVGATKSVEFEVTTYGCPPIGDYTIVNTAYASTSQVVGIADTAISVLHLSPVSGPSARSL